MLSMKPTPPLRRADSSSFPSSSSSSFPFRGEAFLQRKQRALSATFCRRRRRRENNNNNNAKSFGVPRATTTVDSPFTVGLGSSSMYENNTLSATSSIENLGKRGTIATGQPFLDHMIDQLTTHAQLGVSVVVEKKHLGAKVTCEPDTAKYASDEDAEATFTAAGEALGKALKYMLCSEGRIGFAANGRTNGTRFAAPLDEAYASCLIEQFDSDATHWNNKPLFLFL